MTKVERNCRGLNQIAFISDSLKQGCVYGFGSELIWTDRGVVTFSKKFGTGFVFQRGRIFKIPLNQNFLSLYVWVKLSQIRIRFIFMIGSGYIFFSLEGRNPDPSQLQPDPQPWPGKCIQHYLSLSTNFKLTFLDISGFFAVIST